MPLSLRQEDLDPCLIENTTVIATITNSGYLLYTLNMLKSLRSSDITKKVLIVSMDRKGAAALQKRGYHVICAEEEGLGRFSSWNTKGYDQICYIKLQLIYQVLSLGKNILLVDGDIVFHHNPVNNMLSWANDSRYDVWIQNDSDQHGNYENMCTGYLFIRSNMLMMSLYDCMSETGRRKYENCAFDNNDQTFFNKYVKPYCRMNALPLNQYPNGNVFYQRAEQLRNNVLLVHFNWVKGHLKMAKMKEHKMWLLTEEEEVV